jgi:hypothetical protein
MLFVGYCDNPSVTIAVTVPHYTLGMYQQRMNETYVLFQFEFQT